METNALRGSLRYFQELSDPRPGRNVQHRFEDILTLAILAVICGAEGWVDVVYFAECKRRWLATFLVLPHGIASHDTFGRIFALLDPDAFERCFLNWTAALSEATGGRIIAIDGKTLRRSLDKAGKKSAIHLVSAWCEANRIVLGQLAIEEKSNEITAIPKLLDLIDLKGATVTIDAMGCQKEIVRKIVQEGGNYVIQLKANQEKLYEQVKITLDEAILLKFDGMNHDKARKVEKGHGRVETRCCWCTNDISWLRGYEDWPGLCSIACVECKRWINGKQTVERRYYISSLDGKDAKAMLKAARGHWGVENRLHWCLDVSYREDDCRIRKGHGAENFSRLRRIALNLLKNEKTVKAGLKAKSKVAGWNHDYLIKVLYQQ